MFTSLAIGASIFALLFAGLGAIVLLAWIMQVPRAKKKGPAGMLILFIVRTALAAPTCGLAVFLWHKALA